MQLANAEMTALDGVFKGELQSQNKLVLNLRSYVYKSVPELFRSKY